jgi:hypothetical protein
MSLKKTSNVEPTLETNAWTWPLDNKVTNLSASHKTGNSFNQLCDFRQQIQQPKRHIFDRAMNSMQLDTTPVSRSC